MDLIDTTSWLGDEHNEIFPIGARNKQMLWSPPEITATDIKPNWPYLFKESISRYPDQYWTEIVAYIVAKNISIDVPKALPAIRIDEDGERHGALIEWFYDIESDLFIHGELYFKKLNPEFDDKLGSQHNLKDLYIIFRAMKQHAKLTNNPGEWLIDMFLYDSLIGNTDRHQENWGVIFKDDNTATISPLFDNGTSLGHERFPHQIENWGEDRIESYIRKGCHHLRYLRSLPKKRIGQMDSIEMFSKSPDFKLRMTEKLSTFDLIKTLNEIKELQNIKCSENFTSARYSWIEKVIKARHKNILDILK